MVGSKLLRGAKWCPRGCGRLETLFQHYHQTNYLCPKCKREWTKTELISYWGYDGEK